MLQAQQEGKASGFELETRIDGKTQEYMPGIDGKEQRQIAKDEVDKRSDKLSPIP